MRNSSSFPFFSISLLRNCSVACLFFVLTGLVNEDVFHCAEMRMIGSRQVKGVRAEVYSVAAKHGGFYYNSKKESIYSVAMI